MLAAFALAFRQLGDRRFVWIWLNSLALTLALFAVSGVGVYAGLARVAPTTGFAAAAALTIAVGACWLTFRGVAIAVLGLFGDGVVRAVEARHYQPALVTARTVKFGRALLMGLGSGGRLIGYNSIAAPLYLVLLATGIGLPVAFLAVNGWLLGRDLGDMVAVRHLNQAELGIWRAETRGPRFAVGLITAGLFIIPFVNLIAPIVGAAAMTHLFHRRRPR